VEEIYDLVHEGIEVLRPVACRHGTKMLNMFDDVNIIETLR